MLQARTLLTIVMALAVAGVAFAAGNIWNEGPKQTVSIDFAAPGANLCLSSTDTLTGAATNDLCTLGPPAALDATVSVFCFVSATNTVTIKYCCNNGSSACANPAAQTYTYAVIH